MNYFLFYIVGGGLDDFVKKQFSSKVPVPIVAKMNFLYHASDGLSYMHHLSNSFNHKLKLNILL